VKLDFLQISIEFFHFDVHFIYFCVKNQIDQLQALLDLVLIFV